MTEQSGASARRAVSDVARRSELSISRLPSVMARTALSRSTIYLQVSEGTFPRPIALGPRAVGWVDSQIDDWILQRIEASRGRA